MTHFEAKLDIKFYFFLHVLSALKKYKKIKIKFVFNRNKNVSTF